MLRSVRSIAHNRNLINITGNVFCSHMSMSSQTSTTQSAASLAREKEALKFLMEQKGKSSSTLDEIQLSLMKERCILVDDNDTPLRPATKIELHLRENIDGTNGEPPLLHRAFSVFLFDAEGRLLLQKRSPEKITYPSFWANTCCSHPWHNEEEMASRGAAAGKGEELQVEGVRAAARRKLKHELGIDSEALGLEFHFLTRIHYKSYCTGGRGEDMVKGKSVPKGTEGADVRWGEHEIDYILVAQASPGTDIPLDRINTNELAEARYFSQEELDAFLDENLGAPGQGAVGKGKELISPWFRCIAGRGAAVGGHNGDGGETVAGAGLAADGRGLLYTWWEDLAATKQGKWCDPQTIHRFGLVQ